MVGTYDMSVPNMAPLPWLLPLRNSCSWCMFLLNENASLLSLPYQHVLP